MGFGNLINKFMQMKKNGSMAGQAGQRIMKEGGSTDLFRDKMAQEPSSGLTLAEKRAQKLKPPEPVASAPKRKDKDATPQAVLDDVKAKGGVIKKMAKGGVTRGDGCAQRGKTKGRNC